MGVEGKESHCTFLLMVTPGYMRNGQEDQYGYGVIKLTSVTQMDGNVYLSNAVPGRVPGDRNTLTAGTSVGILEIVCSIR
jgi:hypothetical protein